jgi:hypothetical protein
MDIPDIVGKIYTFPDGVKCEILQIKIRSDGPWVTYHNTSPTTIPKKTVMRLHEFLNMYGHLFNLREPPKNLKHVL